MFVCIPRTLCCWVTVSVHCRFVGFCVSLSSRSFRAFQPGGRKCWVIENCRIGVSRKEIS